MIRLFIPSISISFILGCLAAYFFTSPLFAVLVAMCVFGVVEICMRTQVRVVFVCACVAVFLLGMARVIYTDRNVESTLVDDNIGTVLLTGVIVGDVEHKEKHSRYTVRLETDERLSAGDDALLGDGDNARGAERAIVGSESAVLVYEPYPSVCVTGERVSFLADLQEPKDFLTDSGRIFKYKDYLRQSGVYAVVFTKGVECGGGAERFDVFALLRVIFVDAMHQVLPVQEASLLGGLLLGIRGTLSADLLEAFRITGLIHIIVLSGYNITIVSEAVRRLLVRLPRLLSLVVSLVTVIAFVLLAGAQTAAVRAGSMASIALIARATNRENDGVCALLLVAALMVLYNPDQVLFSVSFHMSFLATLGLLICSPIIERYITFVPDAFQVRGIVSATLATQVFLLPYLAYSIGEVSLIGILANILILPIVPLAMALGALVSSVALVSGAVAVVFAPIAYLPLHTIIWVAEYLSLVPFASVRLPEIPALVVVAIIIPFTYVCMRLLKRGERVR